jgi:hypothetical protein
MNSEMAFPRWSLWLQALLVWVAVMQAGGSQVCAQTPDERQFLSLVREAINHAETVRLFKLPRFLLADNPELTARNIPPALIERDFDRHNERLQSLLEDLSKQNSYDFTFMIPARVRAQYGIMFSGPSGTSALLIPVPPADQSSPAITVRFVSGHPLEVRSSSALLADGASLIKQMERLLE